jgi:hypothetical protein
MMNNNISDLLLFDNVIHVQEVAKPTTTTPPAAAKA